MRVTSNKNEFLQNGVHGHVLTTKILRHETEQSPESLWLQSFECNDGTHLAILGTSHRGNRTSEFRMTVAEFEALRKVLK